MITSSDASALASTDAGRSASQNTSVPSRTRGRDPRQGAEGDDRLEAVGGLDRAAVLRDAEEEVVAQPQRVEPAALAERRVRRDRLPREGRLARDRVVELRQREAGTHAGRSLPGSS